MSKNVKDTKSKNGETSKDEQIGFHKGSLSTLAKERAELARILQIVEQLMQMHVAALTELGVDLRKEVAEMKNQADTSAKPGKKTIESIINPIRLTLDPRNSNYFFVSVRNYQGQIVGIKQEGAILRYDLTLEEPVQLFARNLYGPADLLAADKGLFVLEEQAERDAENAEE